MPKFNADDIASELRVENPTWTIQIYEAGGDVDTREVYVRLPETDEHLTLAGFVTDWDAIDEQEKLHPSPKFDWQNDPDVQQKADQWHKENPQALAEYCDIKMVEVRSSNSDSSGGFQSEDEYLAVAYARIRKFLTKKGFAIVDQMKDYF